MTPYEMLNCDNINAIGDDLKKFIDIFKAGNLVKEMEKEVEKYTKLLELARLNHVQTVVHSVSYQQYLYAIPAAYKYINDSQADKRTIEYKENKECFNYLTKLLSELFDVPVSIIDFVSGGYDGYYERIDFKIRNTDTVFTFTIPNTEKLYVNNFHYAEEGKLSLGVLSGDTHYIKTSSYDVEEIKLAFKELTSQQPPAINL